MIDEEATFKKYGYYARDLTQYSHKRIIVVCDDCGKIREIAKCDYRSLCFLCGCARRRVHPNWVGGGITRVCPICGKSFTVSPSVIKNGNGIYCSQKCMGIALSTLIKGEKNPNWNGGKIKRICKTCGTEFFVVPSVIKSGQGLFCSRMCRGIDCSKINKGEKNPNWKGGISFEPYCTKFNDEFKEYIREKFDNVCFLCGKTEAENGKHLSIHHVNYDKHCGCANTEEERKADDNACQFVPLCVSCNSRVNGNRDYWEQYFKNKLRNKLNGWYI